MDTAFVRLEGAAKNVGLDRDINTNVVLYLWFGQRVRLGL